MKSRFHPSNMVSPEVLVINSFVKRKKVKLDFMTLVWLHFVKDDKPLVARAPLGIFLVWFAYRQILGGDPHFTRRNQPLVVIYNGRGEANHFETSCFIK